jgi:NADH-quinone oxidoreductase subunit L
MSGEQDMRKMGALWNKIPITAKTFLVATIAIAGIPPLAGFFSKDAILAGAFETHPVLWVVGWVTAGMTAFYMFRLVNMTFYGESHVSHEAEHHLHESPPSMTVPLMILAGLSIVGGWIGVPAVLGGSDRFAQWLEPVIVRHAEAAEETHALSHATEYGLMLVSVLIALAGIWLARQLYIKKPSVPGMLSANFPRVYNLLYNKYYVDQIYDAMFVHRAKDLGNALGAFDRGVIDGLGVDGTGWMTRLSSRISIWWDSWIVDGLVNLMARIVWMFSIPVRMLQGGRVGGYALLMVVGVLVFLGYYLNASGITPVTALQELWR